MASGILKRACRAVEGDARWHSVNELRSQLESSKRDQRVRALVRIRKQIEQGGLKRAYFLLARKHVNDSDSTCRWQATIVIGEFIPAHGEQVWPIACRLAKSAVADVRVAASTVLLEHLLEYHPHSMIPKFEMELTKGDERFRTSVAACFNFGRRGVKRRIQTLLDRARAI